MEASVSMLTIFSKHSLRMQFSVKEKNCYEQVWGLVNTMRNLKIFLNFHKFELRCIKLIY